MIHEGLAAYVRSFALHLPITEKWIYTPDFQVVSPEILNPASVLTIVAAGIATTWIATMTGKSLPVL